MRGWRNGDAGRRRAAAVLRGAALGWALCFGLIGAPAAADEPSTGGAPGQASPGQAAPAADGGTPEAGEGERTYLDAEGFRLLFEGKTVHLSSGGRHYGSEYYKPGDHSIWIAAGSPCRKGDWYYQSEHICFLYQEDGPYCWRVFRRDGRFFAESTDGFELEIYKIENKPLRCEDDLVS